VKQRRDCRSAIARDNPAIPMQQSASAYLRATGLQRFVFSFATRPHAPQMNFGAFTSGLISFRSRSHEQQVNAHIFCGPQVFPIFAIARLPIKKTPEPQ
jgi:hypothetical protein